MRSSKIPVILNFEEENVDMRVLFAAPFINHILKNVSEVQSKDFLKTFCCHLQLTVVILSLFSVRLKIIVPTNKTVVILIF